MRYESHKDPDNEPFTAFATADVVPADISGTAV